MTNIEDLERRKPTGGSPVWLKRKWDLSPSILLALSPASRKPLSHLVKIAAAPLILAIYSLSNALYGFLTHLFLTQYRFPYVIPLAFAQVVLTLLVLVSLHALGCLVLQPYSLRLGERLLVPSVCEGIHGTLELWAKASAPSGLYPATLCLLPLACLIGSHAMELTPKLSCCRVFLLAAVTLASVAVTGTYGSLWAEPLVCLYAPLNLILRSLSLCWLAKVGAGEVGHKGRRPSSLDLCFTLAVNKSLVLGFLCLVHPDAPRALSEGCWQSLLFLVYLLGVLVLGSLQHLLLGIVSLLSSPVAAALLHTAQGLVKPFTGL